LAVIPNHEKGCLRESKDIAERQSLTNPAAHYLLWQAMWFLPIVVILVQGVMTPLY